MYRCEKCNYVARDKFNLEHHLSRKNPCDQVKKSKKSPCAEKIGNDPPFSGKIEPLFFQAGKIEPLFFSESKKDTPQAENNDKRCNFCLCSFSSAKYKNKHETICKLREDPVRLLELDLCITAQAHECKTGCRFCNKILSSVAKLNYHYISCQKRIDYLENLRKTAKGKESVIINNYTTNNTVNNNIIINIIGEENLDHITPKRIIDMLRNIDNQHEHQQYYLKAGILINQFGELVCENPTNRNLIVPYANSFYAEVKTANGWKKTEINDSLNQSFKNSAKQLYATKDSIDEFNSRVFDFDRNIEVFSEVRQFASKGFNHQPEGKNMDDERQKIRSGCKIAKLKDDF